MVASAKIAQELAALADEPRESLVAQWERAYSCTPPPGVRREMLLYAAAWHLQAKRLGGLSGATKRLLREEVERIKASTTQRAPDGQGSGTEATEPSSQVDTSASYHGEDGVVATQPRRKLGPGARLVREWHGQTFVVDVTDRGYLFEGRHYRSLTAIALQITGAQWSGPRFFGL
ncbi:DUF2924 domain-containing protein [Tianweitania sediminis]|uniref:DUF2924 domain-containing protein n=1 Tax=Tianweitania sediminis TaxID=1502156 RepID=A0A8J7RMV9_9HYPH|nr:DUF2924 domain-containing protein [Tianweitania sediminis]MBP0441281.1 DUF2924 domain-containing protein [Tianweitania sediminis]